MNWTHIVVGVLLLPSVSVSGQTSWQPPRTPDGQPDMQGIWRLGENATERLALFLGLEGDHSRWEGDFTVRGIEVPHGRSYVVDPPDGKIPYQPWALAKRDEHIANMMAPTKREHIDPVARGWPAGVPRTHQIPVPLQILQTRGYVLMQTEFNHAARLIPLDGRPHVSENIKLLMGDSRGRWEGKTLVVDVTNHDGRTWLDMMSFHGDGLRVVERWTLVGPNRIEYRATFTDPTMFTQPWTIAYPFNRDTTEDMKGFEIWEWTVLEGERDVKHMLR